MPILLLLLLSLAYPVYATDEKHHDKSESTQIHQQTARKLAIETAVLSTQTLHQKMRVYGVLSYAPEQLSHIRAPYAGLITQSKKRLGDKVVRGDLLAIIESNDSLKSYSLRAPISGTIIQRHANVGEIATEQVLFSIVNTQQIWAEMRIYPSQMAKVKPGQRVDFSIHGLSLQSNIQHILAVAGKPYALARILLDNTQGKLSAGLLLDGKITIGQLTVPLAVEQSAIQSLDQQRGIFIKNQQNYTFLPLKLGRTDGHWVEVLSHLDSPLVYVKSNSYLIKADIEKNSAEHQH